MIEVEVPDAKRRRKEIEEGVKEDSNSGDEEMKDSQDVGVEGTRSSSSKSKRDRDSPAESIGNKVMRGEGDSRGDIIKDI